MGFLDPKPLTTGALDAAVTTKATTGGTALNTALSAAYAGKSVETTKLDVTTAATTYAPASGALTLTAKQTLDTRDAKALQRFRIALADRDNNPVDILHVGDSITWGYASQPYTMAGRWASVLRDVLRQRFPLTSPVPGGFGFTSVTQIFGSAFTDFNIAITAPGSTTSTGYAVDQQTRIMNGAGAKLVWTVTGTGVDLFYAQYSGGGTLYWKVDGGTATNVSTAGATNNTMKIQIRGLSVGSHTIEIGWVSGTVFANGAMVYNGDELKGIRSWVAAFPSTKSSAWWNVSANYWLDQMVNVQPDLVTIELGPNDYGQNPPNTVATYKANVKNIIATIKTKTTGYIPSFVLLPVWPLVPAGTQPETWQQYVDAMYEIASEDTDGAVCVCDWQNRTSNVSNTTINGILDPDKTHPSALGNRYLAEQLAQFVAPR